MADGSIKISIEVDGKQVSLASKELDKLETSGKKSGQGVKETEKGLKGVNDESAKASGGIKKFVAALGLVAIGAAAFNTLKSSLDSAIARFDTLNAFPKVLQALGVSAEDSERAMQKLGDGIDGLPTTLNDIAANAQRMYTSFNDMDKAADTAIALNNAMLGSGSSAVDAQRGTEQYIQALQKGKFEMDEWKTLQQTMDVGLIKVAESFGYTGQMAKTQLYEALKYGSITMTEFNDKLIEVGTGTGIMADLAKENSLGLATSIGNLKNAAARGIANIIDSFNKLTKNVTGKDIAQNIDSLKVIVNTSFKVMGKAIEGATPFVIAFASITKDTIPVVKALSPAIIGLTAAYASYVAIMKTKATLDKALVTLDTVTQSGLKTLTLLTHAQITAQMAATGATKADIAARLAQTATVKLSTVALGVMNGTITVSTAIQLIASKAAYVFGAAIRFLMGPIGWVVAGIGLLVAGTIAIVKWFKKASAEGEKMSKQTEELAESTESLNSAIDDSSKSYQKSRKQIENNAEANKLALKSLEQLMAKEKKSKADKEELQAYVNSLNNSISDLNLVYGEETDALSMTSEQIAKRIDLMEKQERLQASQDRLTETIQEQVEIEGKLAEINELREEWNQKLEDGTVKGREHKKALKELEEQEAALSEAAKLSAEEQVKAKEDIKVAAELVAEAEAENVGRLKVLYDELDEHQKTAVDSMKSSWEEYAQKATDMFDRLSEKSEVSVSEMTENLEENQRIITSWSENIAKLAERGIDEGLLETLRAAGPSSAGHVNALVQASDAELEKLSDAFAKGGKVATDALSTSLGVDKEALKSVEHLVTSIQTSLRESVKSANFEGLGQDIAKGQAKGIEQGTPEAEKAATKMAKATEDAARDQLQTHSPSKVFEKIGKDSTDGFVLSINKGTSDVVNAMKTLVKSSIDQFKDTPSQFKSIGVNSMAGLNQGLISGRSRVLGTARSIANDITRTMKQALIIQSPSKRFEKEIGYQLPAGIAVGIKNNAKSVYNALNSLSDGMMLSATPEVALGTSRMAYSGGGSSVSNISNTETKYNTVDMKGLFDGANFHVRSENDIPKLAKELNDYIKNGARQIGVIMP